MPEHTEIDTDAERLEPVSDWLDSVVRKPNGQAYGKRAKQKIIKDFDLPVVRIGWAKLINPRAGVAALLRHATAPVGEPIAPRGRGRPRAGSR